MRRCEWPAALWLLCLLPATAVAEPVRARPVHDSLSPVAAGRSTGRTVSDHADATVNPHSDLIFRATGATSCRDCHRVDNAGLVNAQVLNNALVKELKAKATGVHGPGRFADCLRCHAGGTIRRKQGGG